MKTIPPRCEAIPCAGHQVAFCVDGRERLRWHYGAEYPRPFFFPLLGPSGAALTRMGHPGAANHDHHRSIWFGHEKVTGVNFWGDNTPARVRPLRWLCLTDGPDECALATRLGWFDGHDPQELMQQDLVAALRPGPGEAGQRGEIELELQATFVPKAAMLELGQTNFGFLAVRVAKSISAHFGGGQIVDSEGRRGEPDIFGAAARWVDASGPVRDMSLSAAPGDKLAPGDTSAHDIAAATVIEGVTYFDHPSNPGHPARWHVREDGWLGASVCRAAPLPIARDKPLVLRYLLHAHAGDYDAARAAETAARFAASPPYVVSPSGRKHEEFALARR